MIGRPSPGRCSWVCRDKRESSLRLPGLAKPGGGGGGRGGGASEFWPCRNWPGIQLGRSVGGGGGCFGGAPPLLGSHSTPFRGLGGWKPTPTRACVIYESRERTAGIRLSFPTLAQMRETPWKGVQGRAYVFHSVDLRENFWFSDNPSGCIIGQDCKGVALSTSPLHLKSVA
jgi:hypothetical protein